LPPVSQVSAFEHSPVPLPLHDEPPGWLAKFWSHVPLPLHSAFLQSPPVVSVHSVPAATSLFRQAPVPLQVSAPEHSPVPLPVHDVPVASGAVQLCPDSLHESLQFGPTSWPGHGLPLWLAHDPDALHVSVPSQNTPSSQLVPLDWLAKF
jgi:hypothetical protein